MAYEVTITKTDGTKIHYDLTSRSALNSVDPTKKVVFFFDSGEVFTGFTDGSIDEDKEFALKTSVNDKFSAALPANRLLGWAYESDGRIKLPLFKKLRKYWHQHLRPFKWFWIFWVALLIYVLSI